MSEARANLRGAYSGSRKLQGFQDPFGSTAAPTPPVFQTLPPLVEPPGAPWVQTTTTPEATFPPEASPPFVQSKVDDSVYFEDWTSKTRHLVRNGCASCDNPHLCDDPKVVSPEYLDALTLSADFSCEMWTPAVATAMLKVQAAEAASGRGHLLHHGSTGQEDGSSWDGIPILGVSVLAISIVFAIGAGLCYLAATGRMARAKGKKTNNSSSPNKGSGDEDSDDQAPLVGATIQAVPTRQLPAGEEQMELPGTLQALVSLPLPPSSATATATTSTTSPLLAGAVSGSLASRGGQAAPTITSLQQLPTPAQQHQYAPTLTSLPAGPMAVANHMQQGLPTQLLQGGPHQEYDFVTVTRDGLSVSPYTPPSRGPAPSM